MPGASGTAFALPTESVRPEGGRGRYDIVGELAKGGMGTIFKAYDRARARNVALKRPRAEGTKDAQRRYLTLLEQEYRTLLSMRHPRVVEVYDYGYDELGPYYTMELLDGGDLSSKTPIGWRALCGYLRDVASSLALLHARKLVHRDVSPLNIRITGEGRAKLLDFGALTSFGVAKDIVGTPAHIAPEALQRAALDQRLDIFALGATAYYALCGKPAYPATSVHQLTALWRDWTPAPISTYAEDVPPELSALIMAMLCLDPMARPGSAAEVIDKLSAIAGLESDDDERVLTAYLRVPQLVGREDARIRAHAEIRRLMRGEGGALLLEGGPGHGKSVMLAELCQEASIASALVLSARGIAHREHPLATCLALIDHCLAEAPVLCRNAIDSAGLCIGQQGVLRANGLPVAQDDWLRFVTALSSKRPLVLAIDDADDADPQSVLAIAALMKVKVHVLVMLTAQPDPEGAQRSLRTLRRHALRLDLPLLNEVDLETLVRSWFGDLPSARRLSAWLMRQTAGNPASCGEVVAELVRDQHIRYLGGTWQLPHELPRSVSGALSRRIARLSPEALRMSTCLSAQRTALDREDALAVAQRVGAFSKVEAEEAIAELSLERVLIEDDSQVAFASEEIRLALYEHLQEPRRARVHHALAQLLLPAIDDDPAREGQVAYHFLASGDEARAAFHLKRAAAHGTRHGEALVRMVPDFFAVHAEYERMGVPNDERLLATLPLVVSGLYVDPSETQRFGEGVVTLLQRSSGMDLATRMGRFVGAPLAFIVGLLRGLYLYLRLNPDRRFIRWLDAPIGFYGGCAAMSSAAAVRLEPRVHTLLLRLLEHARGLQRFQSARIVYDVVSLGPMFTSGRFAPALAKLRVLLKQLPWVLDIDAHVRRQFEAGFHFYLGYWSAFRGDGEALTYAEALALSDAIHDHIQGECVRHAYHLNRGDIEAANEAREHIDALSAMHGGYWAPDLLSARSLGPYHLGHDVVGLKARLEQLETALVKHPGLSMTRDVARALYEGHRGHHERAVAQYRRLSATLTPFSDASWSYAYSHWVECLNALGRYEEALNLTRSVLALLDLDDLTLVVLYEQFEREEAMALAGLGRLAEALAVQGRLLTRAQGRDHALLNGLVYRDLARVALLVRDASGFREHLGSAQMEFSRIRNPALVALLHSLVALARREGVETEMQRSLTQEFQASADEGRAGATRTTVARWFTDYVVDTLGASSARLYLLEDGQPALCTSAGDDQWSADAAAAVLGFAHTIENEGDSTAMVADDAEGPSAVDEHGLRLLPLQLIVEGEVRTVGILAALHCAQPEHLTPDRLERVARALHEAKAA